VSGDLVALPKAHLHVHLESAIRPSTLVSLGGAPPPAVFAGFGAFVEYNAAIRACLRTEAASWLVTTATANNTTIVTTSFGFSIRKVKWGAVKKKL